MLHGAPARGSPPPIRLKRPEHSIPVPRTAGPCEGSAPMGTDWEDRVTAAWATFEDHGEDEGPAFQAVIDALVAELPDGSPHGPLERACAWDSTGHSDRAVPLHREALDGGLGRRGARTRRGGRASGRPVRCGTPAGPPRASPCRAPNGTLRRTSRTTRCGPCRRWACRTWAVTGRGSRSSWRRSPGISPATGGPWPRMPTAGRARTGHGTRVRRDVTAHGQVTILGFARSAVCAVTGCRPAPRSLRVRRSGRRRRAGRGRPRRALPAPGPARPPGAAARVGPEPAGAGGARPDPARAAPQPHGRARHPGPVHRP